LKNEQVLKITFLKSKAILILFSSQTVFEPEADSKDALPKEIPKLTRSVTIGGTQFTVPNEYIETQIDDTTVKVSRSSGNVQQLEDILDDFPDGIKEIVAASVEKNKIK
jgi:hypothetical protein